MKLWLNFYEIYNICYFGALSSHLNSLRIYFSLELLGHTYTLQTQNKNFFFLPTNFYETFINHVSNRAEFKFDTLTPYPQHPKILETFY